MEALIKNAWLQLGAVGIVAISGWVVSMMWRKDMAALLKDVKAEREAMRLEREEWRRDSEQRSKAFQTVVSENTKTLAILAERVKFPRL